MGPGQGIFGNSYSFDIVEKVINVFVENNPPFEVMWIGRISVTGTHLYSKRSTRLFFHFCVCGDVDTSCKTAATGEKIICSLETPLRAAFFFLLFMGIIELSISFKPDGRNFERNMVQDGGFFNHRPEGVLWRAQASFKKLSPKVEKIVPNNFYSL